MKAIEILVKCVGLKNIGDELPVLVLFKFCITLLSLIRILWKKFQIYFI